MVVYRCEDFPPVLAASFVEGGGSQAHRMISRQRVSSHVDRPFPLPTYSVRLYFVEMER